MHPRHGECRQSQRNWSGCDIPTVPVLHTDLLELLAADIGCKVVLDFLRENGSRAKKSQDKEDLRKCAFEQPIPQMVLHVCQMKFGVSPSTDVLPVRQEKTLVGTVYLKSPGCIQLGVKHVQSQLPSVRKRGCRLPLRSLS